jgi:hypothetical protein
MNQFQQRAQQRHAALNRVAAGLILAIFIVVQFGF